MSFHGRFFYLLLLLILLNYIYEPDTFAFPGWANFKVMSQLKRRMAPRAIVGLKITHSFFSDLMWVKTHIPIVITTNDLLDRYIKKTVCVTFVSRRSRTVCWDLITHSGIVRAPGSTNNYLLFILIKKFQKFCVYWTVVRSDQSEVFFDKMLIWRVYISHSPYFVSFKFFNIALVITTFITPSRLLFADFL